MWTFGKKIAAAFALSFLLLAVIGAISYRSVDSLTQTSYRVTHSHAVLEHIQHLISLMKDAETGQRGFVITGDESYLEPYQASLADEPGVMRELHELTNDAPAQQRRVDDLEPLIAAKLAELKQTIETRRTAGFEATQKIVVGGAGKKTMDDIRRVSDQMTRDERDLLAQRAAEVESSAQAARNTIVFGTLFCLLLIVLAGFLITRSLTSQVGAAVQHVQSSSAELQAAANQQLTGAKEQATALSQISTTVSELLATSRQIAESAQRVAQIATETGTATKSGDLSVQKTSDSVIGIRRQVDLIVNHMLDLGKKSQQIGGILEIINELAEQTNILSINATIEAAEAGDAGRRFGVVAAEIRKLADRVAGSVKEIRGLVDEIRSAVNSTVMATEGGSKAVDAGARQFGEVTTSFREIASLISTTTDAAKEIQLSTKQQAGAVEQVTLAISNISMAARETETSSGQTLQTSSQLINLSKELSRLIRPQAA